MKVACVLIGNLPARAEQRRHPVLRGKPVVVTESRGSSRVVLDSSPEATGVSPGMPLQEALSRHKDAIPLQADMSYYHAVFDRAVRLLEQRSPVVEKAGLGCAYVGLDGLEAMYGSEARLVTSLLQAVPHDLEPRVGLAKGKFPAYVAAVLCAGGRASRVPEDAAGFLARLSVDLLPLTWENRQRLHRFGLHTMGRLASLPMGAVQAQFGPDGREAWELANGIDSRPLLPHGHEETVVEQLSFPAPVTTVDTVLLALDTLLGRAFARPALRGRFVRTAALEGRVLSRPPWTKSFAFKEAVNSRERAYFALKGVVQAASPPGALEDLTVTLAGLTGESGVQSSFFSDVRRQEQLREMMGQLEARLRTRPPVYRIRDIEPWSRIPERRQALVQFDP